MEKQNIYLFSIAILAVMIIALTGEYFTYKYNVLIASEQQAATQQNQQPATTTYSTSTTTTQTPSGTSDDLITLFNFSNPSAIGTIDQTQHTITVNFPPDTDVTNLKPTVGISQYAKISPSLNVSQDFTNPVMYTVTGQDGATQNYTVTANIASVLNTLSNSKSISSFTLSGLTPAVDGFINEAQQNIYVVVPDGTNLTDLVPTITVSKNATVNPQSGNPQDFTNPVTYTVTAQDGSTQSYTVTIVTESNSG